MKSRPKLNRELRFWAPLLTLGVSFSACDGPQTSGTKTNWLAPCDTSIQCGDEGSCICGLCTLPCLDDAECGGGVCGTGLATAAQCESFLSAEPRLCLAAEAPIDGAGCTNLPLPLDAPLGLSAPVECSHAGALVCESFDRPLPDVFSTWQQPGGSGSLTDCPTFQGNGALRMTAIDGGHSQTRMRLPTPLASGAVHARFYLRITGDSILPEQTILFEYWDHEEVADGGQTSTLIMGDGRLAAFVGAGDHFLPASSMAPLERDRWYCVEVENVISDSAGTIALFVDGQPILEGTELDTLPEAPLSVAVIEAQPQLPALGTSVTVLVDELVIATEAIGCDG